MQFHIISSIIITLSMYKKIVQIISKQHPESLTRWRRPLDTDSNHQIWENQKVLTFSTMTFHSFNLGGALVVL